MRSYFLEIQTPKMHSNFFNWSRIHCYFQSMQRSNMAWTNKPTWIPSWPSRMTIKLSSYSPKTLLIMQAQHTWKVLYHFFGKCVTSNRIRLNKLHSKDNMVDDLTKELATQALQTAYGLQQHNQTRWLLSDLPLLNFIPNLLYWGIFSSQYIWNIVIHLFYYSTTHYEMCWSVMCLTYTFVPFHNCALPLSLPI